jgi:hypothetical protein
MKPNIQPTEQMLELKRNLLLTPTSERRAILDKAMEISRQRRKLKALKVEKEELEKQMAERRNGW